MFYFFNLCGKRIGQLFNFIFLHLCLLCLLWCIKTHVSDGIRKADGYVRGPVRSLGQMDGTAWEWCPIPAKREWKEKATFPDNLSLLTFARKGWKDGSLLHGESEADMNQSCCPNHKADSPPSSTPPPPPTPPLPPPPSPPSISWVSTSKSKTTMSSQASYRSQQRSWR